LQAGQISQAKRAFDQALSLDRTSSQARSGLGYVALARNRVVLAAEHFSVATRGGDDDAWITLADAYRRLGKNREALHAYQSYVSRKPDGDQLELARTQIDRIGEELAQGRKSP
jgi:Tfp pilus assembly protein PilF